MYYGGKEGGRLIADNRYGDRGACMAQDYLRETGSGSTGDEKPSSRMEDRQESRAGKGKHLF